MDFDYIDLTEEQIAKLECCDGIALASAGLMVVNGLRKGILEKEEGEKQLHNILLAILVIS